MLTGPDVSSYQHVVDWAKVAAAGHAFAACKATEGKSYLDPTFARNWQGIKAASLVRCAYHFAHPDRNSPDIEAGWFLGHCQPQRGDLVMLDYETAPYTRSWAERWAALVGAGGITVCLYYPASQGGAFNGTPLPRWPASYGARAPKPWRFWQYTDKAAVPGVPGPCDLSYFDGTLAELHALAGLAPPQPLPDQPVHDYPEDTVRTKLISIGPLGPDGNGYNVWDPGFGRDPVPVGEPCQQGPRPEPNADNDYWLKQAQTKIRCAPEAGHLVVSVVGGPPGGTILCWVSAA